MLIKHVLLARTAANLRWDEARAARVLERALDERRAALRHRSVGWIFALASVAAAGSIFVRRVGPSLDNSRGVGPNDEPRPSAVTAPVEALDGGKQTG